MGYLARDIMSRNVICIPTQMDLRNLAKLFLEEGITGAPVLDGDGNLAGVISQKDLLFYNLSRDDELRLDTDFYQQVKVEGHHLPAGFQIKDMNTGRVTEVMTPVVHAVSETTTLEAVARMMTRKHIHRVIVRKGRKVAGIISALDILRVLGADAPPATPRRKAASRKKPARKTVRKASRSRKGKTAAG